jgi:hypothetical protein
MPVELLVAFDDGRQVRERWDGRYRWQRFTYRSPHRVRLAVVDPERTLALDVNPGNNTWLEKPGVSRRAATKWAGRFLLWLQSLLELQMAVA